MITIFIVSVAILIYHLIGYGILLRILSQFKRIKKYKNFRRNHYPTITILCPAFNEESVIEKKIKSRSSLYYFRHS